jgi:transposase-like protein
VREGSSIKTSGRKRSTIVRESSRPIARIARELGINDGILGDRVTMDRLALERDDVPMTAPPGPMTARAAIS